MKTYVMIECSMGTIDNVVKKLQEIPKVKTCDMVTGMHDIIVVMEAADLDEMGRIILDKVQMITGVTKTSTCYTIPPRQT